MTGDPNGGGDGALPTVSVVMATYNRASSLEPAVRAALRDEEVYEVVVVVDGSQDGSLELLAAIADEDDRLRPLWVDNGGQFRALAAGVNAASGDVVLLIDDDVVLRPGTAAAHARHHAGQAGLVVLGYMPTRVARPRRPGQFATWVYADDYEWQCHIYDNDPSAILRNLWGGNVSMRTSDCQRIGLVQPGGDSHYNEDRDFGLRCMKAGLRGVFDRKLVADHLHARPLPVYLADARRRASGTIAVHSNHSDVLGPLSIDRYLVTLPLPARIAIRLGARLPRRLTPPLVRTVVRGVGALRWWKAESLAGIVAMHIIEVQTIVDANLEGGGPSTRR